MEAKVTVNQIPHTNALQVSISLPTIAVAISMESLAYHHDDYAAMVAENLMKTLNNEVYKAVGIEIDKLADSVETEAPDTFQVKVLESLQATTNPEEKVTWKDVENAYKDWAPTELESDLGHPTETALAALCAGLNEKVYCPEKDECGYTFAKISLSAAIQHLNDSAHNWSREQIADWLETLDIDININMKEDNNAD